jgi:biotin carboxyl carrier protein
MEDSLMKNISTTLKGWVPKKTAEGQVAKAKMPRRRIVISAVVALVVLAVAASVYIYRANQKAATAQVDTSALQTAVARRGNLTVSASAAGQVVTSDEVSLGFDEDGTLSELLVKVGDQVTASGHRHRDAQVLEVKVERLMWNETLFNVYPDRN